MYNNRRSSCFFLKHGGGGTLGIVKSPVWNSHTWYIYSTVIYNDHKNTKINHAPLSASHNLMYFSFLSERKAARGAKRLVLYPLIDIADVHVSLSQAY